MSLITFVDRYFADTENKIKEAYKRSGRLDFYSTFRYSDSSSYITDLVYTELLLIRLRVAALWKKLRVPRPSPVPP
jgi:hypothetical protein